MRKHFLFTIAIFAAVVMLSGIAFAKAPAKKPAASSLNPWAQLLVHRDDKSGSVSFELTTYGKPGGDKRITHTVPKGVEIWNRFDNWYEDLFSLTYATADYKRLWKQVRQRGSALAEDFFTQEMVGAIEGTKLLVVVDETKPFPADTFRFGDRWLFEIAPIVHTFNAGPKDLTDVYDYKSVLVLDCQGPKDREGQEAPGVSKNLAATPGASHKLLISLKRDETLKNLKNNPADILHLATHAYPDEFFPGRNKPGIKATEIGKLKLRYHFVLSTGCNTGNPVFARGWLDSGARFFVASMYVTSGKDGIVFGDAMYRQIFSGKTPFEAFYAVKGNITGNKSDFPDIARFVFFVK